MNRLFKSLAYHQRRVFEFEQRIKNLMNNKSGKERITRLKIDTTKATETVRKNKNKNDKHNKNKKKRARQPVLPAPTQVQQKLRPVTNGNAAPKKYRYVWTVKGLKAIEKTASPIIRPNNSDDMQVSNTSDEMTERFGSAQANIDAANPVVSQLIKGKEKKKDSPKRNKQPVTPKVRRKRNIENISTPPLNSSPAAAQTVTKKIRRAKTRKPLLQNMIADLEINIAITEDMKHKKRKRIIADSIQEALIQNDLFEDVMMLPIEAINKKDATFVSCLRERVEAISGQYLKEDKYIRMKWLYKRWSKAPPTSGGK